jgi:hypothetical protein
MSGSSQPTTSGLKHPSDRGTLATPTHDGASHDHADVIQHETLDARTRPLVVAGFVLLAVTVFAFVLIWVVFFAFAPQGSEPVNMRPLPTVAPVNLPPGPLLQANPDQEVDVTLSEQREILNSYGWINEREGVVHIPIDRAKDLVVERGITAPTPSE